MQKTANEETREKLLAGRKAVVTGAGSGVGRAIATLFAQSGCSVEVVDVVPERVAQVVNEIKRTGARVDGMVHNLSNMNEVDLMIDESLKNLGKIDILCNNAGIMDGAAPVAETTDELWERVLNINLNAPFRASRRVIPHMLKAGGGVIINTASVAGIFGGVAGAAYTVSKHALIGLTKSTAAHYGTQGIRCNAMVLGGVNTNIGVGSKSPNALGMAHLTEVAGLIPRMGESNEIAELALFLASHRSSYLNGSCIVIDGGWTVL